MPCVFWLSLYRHFRALAVFHLDVDTLDGGTRANRPAVEVVVSRLAVVMPGDARCKFYTRIVGSRRHCSSCHLLEFLTLSQIKMRCRGSDALHRNDEIATGHDVIRTGLGKQLAVKLVIYIQLARGRRGSNITETSIPQSRDTIRDADGGQAGTLIVSIIS